MIVNYLVLFPHSNTDRENKRKQESKKIKVKIN